MDLEYESILTDIEIAKFNNVSKHYLRALALEDKDYIKRTQGLLMSNLEEAERCLTHLKPGDLGYYGSDYPKLASEALRLTKLICQKSTDTDVKELAEKVASLLEKALKNMGIAYEDYEYGYPEESRGEKYKRIEAEEAKKYLQQLQQREEDEIRQHIQENLPYDIVLKDLSKSAFGHSPDRPITTAEQVSQYEKWQDIDYRLSKAISEIMTELAEKKAYQEKVAQLNKEEQELSKDEEAFRNQKSKLLDLAVELIIKSGSGV